jgi:hypothetical protein
MRPLRTAQDIRGAPKGLACIGSSNEQWAYAMLARLARERQRLLTQQTSWQRRLGQIARRLDEIDALTGRLHEQLPQTCGGRQIRGASHHSRGSGPTHRPIVLKTR